MPLNTTLERGISVLGYPAFTREVVNRFVDDVQLDVHRSARISSGCLLRGHVSLGSQARLSRGCVLNGDVTVGRGTNLEPNCELVGEVTVGNYCAIARHTTFQQTNHEMRKPAMQIRLYDEVLDSRLEPTDKGPIEVGNDVWLGTRSAVLSGVTIGDGAVVGAGSIVTDDVEPYSIVAGVPAERVKWRFPAPVRNRLVELEWWEWDERTIREHSDFFEREIRSVDDVPDVDASAGREPPEPRVHR